MFRFLKTRGVDLAVATVGLTVFMTDPAWAQVKLPGPAAGGFLAGAAIIGALVIAKLRRRN